MIRKSVITYRAFNNKKMTDAGLPVKHASSAAEHNLFHAHGDKLLKLSAHCGTAEIAMHDKNVTIPEFIDDIRIFADYGFDFFDFPVRKKLLYDLSEKGDHKPFATDLPRIFCNITGVYCSVLRFVKFKYRNVVSYEHKRSFQSISPIVSTFMRFVFPDFPFVIPPVRTILSPDFRFICLCAVCIAW